MGLLDYHSRRSSKKIRRQAENVQIEWTEAEVYSNIDLDLSFAKKHVLSHCHLSVIPLLRPMTNIHACRPLHVNDCCRGNTYGHICLFPNGSQSGNVTGIA